ncbi:MAG: 50S ribosomal protein L3 [Chloroflexi bacterium]|nr:50S ribosomal protein L3 [Chloroflexota bacterium]MCL5950524.1 50S ribosomal protein L3 [Chloroflexota bacterium]
MAEGLLGKKVGMGQIFTEKGEVVPVTVLEAGPCFVTQIKTTDKDGYNALQLGFSESKRLTKPQRGHLKNLPPLKHLQEVRTGNVAEYQLGQKIGAGLFAVGDLVDVSGISKGKGHAGVVKRHHFRGGPVTHGQSDRLRRPGASGATTTPGRVLRGMRMAGQMGNANATVLNLEVVQVDSERNVLVVKGAVPGANDGLVFIRRARKEKKRAKK